LSAHAPEEPAAGSGVTIETVPWDDPEADRLRTAQQDELKERYGGVADLEPHIPPEGVAAMLLVRVDGVAAGCGALRGRGEGIGELKRMFVLPEFRGRGLSRLVLVELERRAVALGWERLILETGVLQPEAIGLYLSEGYAPMPNYPPYDVEADSRCFTKLLPAGGAAARDRPGLASGAARATRAGSPVGPVPRAERPAVELLDVPFDDPRAVGLRREMYDEMAVLYPDRDVFIDAFDAMEADIGREARVTVLATVDGRAVGTAILRPAGDRFGPAAGEVKKVFVRPDARGLGVARRLMAALEVAARDVGWSSLVLQTGSRQPEAIALYASHGYRAIAPYGPYVGDAVSLCFQKVLDA
jgi:GNAT superfamily N-acetyltransferase